MNNSRYEIFHADLRYHSSLIKMKTPTQLLPYSEWGLMLKLKCCIDVGMFYFNKNSQWYVVGQGITASEGTTAKFLFLHNYLELDVFSPNINVVKVRILIWSTQIPAVVSVKWSFPFLVGWDGEG